MVSTFSCFINSLNRRSLIAYAFIIIMCAFSAQSKAQTQIINADVLIKGSQCLGNDCVDPESFGYSTLRLKENNVRIEFDDTSMPGGFPDNDWELIANDNFNGGLNKFYLWDRTHSREVLTIEANAPNYAQYIKANGYVGLGTNNAQQKLHIITGNTPSIRLEQDMSGGYYGAIYDIGGNEQGIFMASQSGKFLRVLTGAPENSFYMHGTGNLSLGSTVENGKLYVNGNMVINGNVNLLSDARMKTNIAILPYGLREILKLQPRKYQYISSKNLNLPSGDQLGLLAQNVKDIIPEAVSESFAVEGESERMMSVNYIELIPVLINAVQEQQAIIDQKDQTIHEIKILLAKLESRINDLENKKLTE